MTDRELAGCALSEVLALLEKATPGPWAWASNGNVVPVPYKDVEVAAVYSEHEDDTLMPANAKAIINAVAFLRQHGPALLAAISNPSSEGDGRDAEDAARWRWAKQHFRVMGLDMSGQHHWAANAPFGRVRGPTIDAAIDAAIAAAERGGAPDLS